MKMNISQHPFQNPCGIPKHFTMLIIFDPPWAPRNAQKPCGIQWKYTKNDLSESQCMRGRKLAVSEEIIEIPPIPDHKTERILRFRLRNLRNPRTCHDPAQVFVPWGTQNGRGMPRNPTESNRNAPENDFGRELVNAGKKMISFGNQLGFPQPVMVKQCEFSDPG